MASSSVRHRLHSLRSLGALALLLLLSLAVVGSSATADSDDVDDEMTVVGKWTVEYIPRSHTSVRAYLLSEMSGRSNTVRVSARFVPIDVGYQKGSNKPAAGVFKRALSSIFPNVCRSSPDPEFWDKYGKLLMPTPNSIQVAGTGGGAVVVLSLDRIPASRGGIYLPGGRVQEITCGPIQMGNDRSAASSPTTTGAFLKPSRFTFRIEQHGTPMLSIMRFPDFMPAAGVHFPRATVPHALRTEFSMFEIFASQEAERTGIMFYVGAVGSEFKVGTEEERERLQRYFAFDGLRCWPAPCHQRMRNRTFDFPSLRAARKHAVEQLSPAAGENITLQRLLNFNDKTELSFDDTALRHYLDRSWIDGSSDMERNSIFRPHNIKIVNAGAVLVSVTPDELAERGFDLPPHLDDVMANKVMPKDPAVYRLFVRPPPPELCQVPFERNGLLLNFPYIQIEAPYHPQQIFKLAKLDADKDEYNPALTPVVLTDRCFASGLMKDVDAPLADVLPTYINRCPGDSFIIHASMVPALHPLGAKMFNEFTPARCFDVENQMGCKRHIMQEIPPKSSAWAEARLKDIPGFDVDSCRTEKKKDAKGGDGDDNNLAPDADMKNVMKMMQKMGAEEEQEEQACNPRNDRRNSYILAGEKVMPDEMQSGKWLSGFEVFSEGAMRIKVSPTALTGFRSQGKVTLLSVELPPHMVRYPRNGQPSFPTHMTIVVVPSPGVLRLLLSASAFLADEGGAERDGRVPLPAAIVNEGGESSIPTGTRFALDLSWTLDGFDSFSDTFIHAAQSDGGSDNDGDGAAAALRTQWAIVSHRNFNGRVASSSARCEAWQKKALVRASAVRFGAVTSKRADVHLEFEAPPEATEAASAASPGAVSDTAVTAGDLWNEAGNCALEVLPPPMVAAEWTTSKQRPLAQPLRLLYTKKRVMQHLSVAGVSVAHDSTTIGPIRYSLAYMSPSINLKHADEWDEQRCQRAFTAAVAAKENWRGLSADATLRVVYHASTNVVTGDFDTRPLLLSASTPKSGPGSVRVSSDELYKKRGRSGDGWSGYVVVDNVKLELTTGSVLYSSGEASFTVPASVSGACGAPEQLREPITYTFQLHGSNEKPTAIEGVEQPIADL